MTIVKHPQDIIPLIQKYSNKRQEHFGVICVGPEMEVLGVKVLFVGSEHNSIVDSKMIFWYALSKKASSIILFHNHPSQNLIPSELDIDLTKNINQACHYVGVKLLDHLIIGKYAYYSFLEHDLVLKKDKEENKVAEVTK